MPVDIIHLKQPAINIIVHLKEILDQNRFNNNVCYGPFALYLPIELGIARNQLLLVLELSSHTKSPSVSNTVNYTTSK